MRCMPRHVFDSCWGEGGEIFGFLGDVFVIGCRHSRFLA